MTRIFAEQDLEKIPDVVYTKPVNPFLEKRYYLTIMSDGIRCEPMFQVFIGHSIVDNNKEKKIYYNENS